MKKVLIITILFFLSQVLLSATPDSLISVQLQHTVGQLKTELKNQKADFQKQQSEMNKNINDLRSEITNERKKLDNLVDSLKIRIDDTRTDAAQQIANVDKSLGKATLWAIIGILGVIVITGLVFVLLQKRQKSNKTDIIIQLNKAKSVIMSESAKLDKDLADLLEKQFSVLSNTPIDHTMPLKIADEITRINTYTNTLDPNSQDAKALKSSVKRLFNTLKAAQYEVVDLLGQKYDDGLKVIVSNFVPNENLKEGEEIISRIIKPCVKYKGEQIQAAQVDISVGESK